MLVMSTINAVSERSFSTFKRVKTNLRSTTDDATLSLLMLLQLHGHKELGDGIDIVEVANLFVENNQWRKQSIEKFSSNDMPLSISDSK